MQTVPLIDTQLLSNSICNFIRDVVGNLGDFVLSLIKPIIDKVWEDRIVGDQAALWEFVLEDIEAETGGVQLRCVVRSVLEVRREGNNIQKEYHSSP